MVGGGKGGEFFKKCTTRSEAGRHDIALCVGERQAHECWGSAEGVSVGLIIHTMLDVGELLGKHVNGMNVGFQTEVCKNCDFRPQPNLLLESSLCQDVRNSK